MMYSCVLLRHSTFFHMRSFIRASLYRKRHNAEDTHGARGEFPHDRVRRPQHGETQYTRLKIRFKVLTAVTVDSHLRLTVSGLCDLNQTEPTLADVKARFSACRARSRVTFRTSRILFW